MIFYIIIAIILVIIGLVALGYMYDDKLKSAKKPWGGPDPGMYFLGAVGIVLASVFWVISIPVALVMALAYGIFRWKRIYDWFKSEDYQLFRSWLAKADKSE